MKNTTRLAALTLALTASLALSPAAARAEDAPSPPSVPVEVAIGGGQLLLGGGVAYVGGMLLALGYVAGGAGGAAVVWVAAPPLTGAMVCWLGGKSPAYDDDCDNAVLGSYLGSLATIPGMLLGAAVGSSGEQDMSGAWGILVGGLMGYMVGTPVGATIGWHLGKDRRQPPAFKVGPPAPCSRAC